jgi:hypothetical protein
MNGHRIIALALALIAGAITLHGGDSRDQAVGRMIMVVSGIWLLIELLITYKAKKF